MKPLVFVASTAAIVFGLTCTAFAQSPDTKYCQALSDKYKSYVTDNGDKKRPQAPASVSSAMAQCQSNPASAIPTLEQALKDQKIDLPPRS